jgi:DNA-cytosine methyltransferase
MNKQNRPFTYISLFSGIGGFELGIHKVFPDAVCLGYSEINPDAIEVYNKHFPNHPALGNINNIDGKFFRGKVDLLVGGSPCQDFSSLGSGKGLKGKKSNLFFSYLRLLKEIKPKYFILENVKMKNEYQDIISNYIGYDPILIDSNIVSCQRRKRLYWCNFYIENIIKIKRKTFKDILVDEKQIADYPLIYKDLKKDNTKTGKILRNIIKGNLDPYFRILYDTDIEIPTVHTSFHSHYFIYLKSNVVRQIHPIEMEKLQTFPEDWTNVLSKSKRYNVIANAVTCDVISHIMSFLKD